MLKDYESVKCDTFTADVSQLYALRLNLFQPSDHVILPYVISMEPLAPVVRQEIWAAIHALKRAGLSILVIDKTLKELSRVADRCFILERGRTVWTGTPAGLTDDVADRYLGV